jgi:hypothetical protein
MTAQSIYQRRSLPLNVFGEKPSQWVKRPNISRLTMCFKKHISTVSILHSVACIWKSFFGIEAALYCG